MEFIGQAEDSGGKRDVEKRLRKRGESKIDNKDNTMAGDSIRSILYRGEEIEMTDESILQVVFANHLVDICSSDRSILGSR